MGMEFNRWLAPQRPTRQEAITSQSPPPAERRESTQCTPPPHHAPLYACVPIPTQLRPTDQQGLLTINAALSASGRPETSFRSRSQPTSAAHEPATQPQLPSLTLIIQDIPWTVTVHASVTHGGFPVVTVGDVLNTLHQWLQLPASETGLFGEELQNTQGAHRRRGRRVDYLNGRTTFIGLSPSQVGSDVLIAHFV